MITVYIDLDESLLDRRTAYNIVLAGSADKILYTLSETQYLMMTSVWKRYDLKFRNNLDGKIYWLSKNIWNEIQSKRKSLTLQDIEVIETDLGTNIKDNKLFALSLSHLRNIDCEINLISNMHMDSKDNYMPKVVDFIQQNTGKEVVKTFYVDDIVQDNSRALSTKMKIVLEKIIGYKIKANKFTSLRKEVPEEVRYYTSDEETATILYGIQQIFEKWLTSSPIEIQREIKDRGAIAPLKLAFITNNNLNKFKVLTLDIIYPRYIRKFEDYNPG